MSEVEPANIPLFTYGTLQPGAALWSMLGPYVQKRPATAYVKGFELYANASLTYPYLVQSQNPEMGVFGTMTFLPYIENGALDRICQMEIGAGYTAETVAARYMSVDPDGGRSFKDVQALAFLWPASMMTPEAERSYGRLMGPKIPSGSWLEFLEEREAVVLENELEKIPANRSPKALVRLT